MSVNSNIYNNRNPNIKYNIQNLFVNAKIASLLKKGGSVHRTDIFPGVIDTNANLDNMSPRKKKKKIKKHQDGGEIEVVEYNPVVLSLKKLDYPELNSINTKTLDVSSLSFDKFIPPSINNTHVQENYPINPNISLEDLLKQEGVNARVSSGYRKGAMSKNGHKSNHSHLNSDGTPGAYDIVPNDGNFENLRKEIYGNPRIISWLKAKGWGILEETTSDIMKKTGATGKHWHFGPDTAAIDMSKKNGINYAKFGGLL